jgi:predicted Fe-Mo cluster-binding NifX family protein
MDNKNSTLAFVTDDGVTISAHFGRALHYEIVRLQDGKVVERNRVSKAGHHTWGEGAHTHGGHEGGRHQGEKHAAMTAPLTGVSVLVARGMGMGAQQHLIASGIEPLLTDLHTIDEAVDHYVAGTLVNNPRRLHDHGPHH